MAPNPSAALRVLLAATLAAGPMRPAVAFAAGEPPTEPGLAFVVLQVGDVVPKYNAIVLRAKDLVGLAEGGEKEVDAVIPENMERQGTFTGHTYKLLGKTEKVKVKMVQAPRTLKSGRWQISRAGAWVTGSDKKPATFEGCVPNGDRRCFNGIAGVARNFIVAASGATAPPAPAPVPPSPPGGSPPAPGGDFAGPFPWRSAPLNDTANGVEHRKCKRAECTCAGDACKGKRINLYAVTKAEKAGDTVKFTMTLDADNYLTSAAGKWNLCWNSGTRASVPVATMAGFPDSKFLPDASYWVKGAPAGADFKGVKKAEFSWSGAAPAKPKDASPECAYDASTEPAPPPVAADELDKKLDELFTDKVERAGADWLAETYGGKTGPEARKAFLDALKGPGAAAAVVAARGKVRQEIAVKVGLGKPESVAFVGKRGVTKEDLQKYICDLLPEGGGTVAPAGGATSAKEQLGVVDERSRAAAAATSDAGTRGTAQIDEQTPAAAQNPAANLGFEVTPELKAQCAIFRSRPTPPPTAGPGFPRQAPNIVNERPVSTPDAEKPDGKADADKKKKNLQRAAIGGAGGALVLGVFGFIFGGPIGAIAMGAIGFGVMAGITYMNNNPIE
jgi:hypothetical protein